MLGGLAQSGKVPEGSGVGIVNNEQNRMKDLNRSQLYVVFLL